jgi:hypothetical protein
MTDATPLQRSNYRQSPQNQLVSFENRRVEYKNNSTRQILAKGHNETYEMVIPMEYARFLTISVGEHVSENGIT